MTLGNSFDWYVFVFIVLFRFYEIIVFFGQKRRRGGTREIPDLRTEPKERSFF